LKILDSKIGVRATRFRIPSVLISLNDAASEETGECVGGSLAWPGSFQLAFELDSQNRLRALAGINPFGSQYNLPPSQTFVTPPMLWTWSDHGKGQVTRNFHRWALKYGIRDGDKPRPVLLNNWEATHTDFDEQKIVRCSTAPKISASSCSSSTTAGSATSIRATTTAPAWRLGRQPQETPHGSSTSPTKPKKRGLRFGIWIEPEMVNPQSELYEAHPDWAIVQKNREPELSRNQLVLDLTRPRCSSTRGNPSRSRGTRGVAYVKWDANRYVTQPGSTISRREPDAPAGRLQLAPARAHGAHGEGSTRRDGDGVRRRRRPRRLRHDEKLPQLLAQRQYRSARPREDPVGLRPLLPRGDARRARHAHGQPPLKFACDVALSGAFGVDRDVSKMSATNAAITNAIAIYKSTLREITSRGDLYRLESPYDGPRAALNYVLPDRSKAAVFVYQLTDGERQPIKPRGLDASRRYQVRELNVAADPMSERLQIDRRSDADARRHPRSLPHGVRQRGF
jgi:alpha-galactosidase